MHLANSDALFLGVPSSLELFTDLYELTMAQAYSTEHMDQLAVFELAFRQTPATRNYIVAKDIEDVINFLTGFRLSSSDMEHLRERTEFVTIS